MNFAVPANYRMKLKEDELRDMYLDLAGELKKLLNMKLTVISIVICVLRTVPKGLLKGLNKLEIEGQNRLSRIIKMDQNAEKSPGNMGRICCNSDCIEK